MKALGCSAIPHSGTWHCEIKYDGYRVIAVLNRGRVELWSRNHKPLDYPELIGPLKKLKCNNAILDGEIVALDSSGRSNFQALQGRDLGERPPIVLYLFDLLLLNNASCLELPIEERRQKLTRLTKNVVRPLQLSPVFDVSPARFLAKARRIGLEGIIMKQAGSKYEPDCRSGAWLKIKNLNEQEFVIGGFTPPRNSRMGFGAILIGYYSDRKLIYAGKVGTGFDAAMLRQLHADFLKRKISECPFANLPLNRSSRFGTGMTRSVMATVTWIRPKLVAQIRFAEWTLEGILRQPVFLGLRKDKAARDVRRESPAPGRKKT